MTKRLIFICSIIVIFIPGCFYSYENYGYKPIENKADWGIVGVKLIGSEYKKFKKFTIMSPYNLLIWFTSINNTNDNVKLNNVIIFDKLTRQKIFAKNNIGEKRFDKVNIGPNKHEYSAYFNLENIAIDYKEVVISIEYEIVDGATKNNIVTEFSLEKDHKTFRRINGV